MAKAPLPEQFAIASDHTDAQSLGRSTKVLFSDGGGGEPREVVLM